jgi:C-terminal processing protease CtpA/Prc
VRTAISALTGTRALILDLRELSGSAPASMLEPLLQPFTAAEKPWLVRHDPHGKPQARTVSPGEVRYAAPVAVLIDRWTAGAGENLAAGLSACGARLVGTPMAGFATDVAELRLPRSELVVQFPTARAFHVGGTRVDGIRPSIPVDLAAPSGGPGDPILYQALKLFDKG